MTESEDDRRGRLRRGTVAGGVLVACLVSFDVVFLVGAVTHPTWWRYAILILLIALQAAVISHHRPRLAAARTETSSAAIPGLSRHRRRSDH